MTGLCVLTLKPVDRDADLETLAVDLESGSLPDGSSASVNFAQRTVEVDLIIDGKGAEAVHRRLADIAGSLDRLSAVKVVASSLRIEPSLQEVLDEHGMRRMSSEEFKERFGDLPIDDEG